MVKEGLDKALSPRTTMAQRQASRSTARTAHNPSLSRRVTGPPAHLPTHRQVLFQDLLARREEVLEDVQSAVSAGSAETLLPEDSEARRAASGAAAVARQLADDIVPALLSEVPPKLPTAMPELIARAQASVERAKPTTGVDLTRLVDLEVLSEQATRMVASTPPGLQQPEYEVEADLSSGVEIRRYEAYAACTTALESGSEALPFPNLVALADAWDALSAYISGENDQGTSIAMTTPVSFGDGAMSFALGGGVDAQGAPMPKSPRVFVTEVAPARVAIKGACVRSRRRRWHDPPTSRHWPPPATTGHRPPATGPRPPAPGHWPLATGH